MTDWGGGQSTAFVAKHGGCDMVMPGGNANVILQGYYSTEPTFNEDGSFANLGDFVIDPEGEPLFTVPTNVASENQLSEELAAAVAARQARYQKIGTDATLTWYGYYEHVQQDLPG
jgi:methyl coenzyme M reductase alpha subunit